LFEDPGQRLLGNLERVEQGCDRQAGFAVDEMDDTVMGAPETGRVEDGVGVGNEITVGEEQQLYDLEVNIVVIPMGWSRIWSDSGLIAPAGSSRLSFQICQLC
jgi:hypothetical protein